MRSLRRRCQTVRSQALGHSEAYRVRLTPAELAELRLVGAAAGVEASHLEAPTATLIAELALEAVEARIKAGGAEKAAG